MEEQDKILSNLENKYNQVSRAKGETSQEAKSLKSQINNLTNEYNQNKTQISTTEKESKKLSKTLDSLKNSTEQASQGFTVMKGAMSNLVADGIKSVSGGLKDLATETDNASTVFEMMTGTSAEAMTKFNQEIQNIYNSGLGESLTEVSQAMAEIKNQTKDIDTATLGQFTSNALQLQEAFGFDIQESIKAVNMLTTQFGITGQEAFNLIVQGVQNGLNKNNDLLDVINEYSVQFASSGDSAEDFFNRLQNSVNAGTFSIDKSADAFKEFTIKITEGGEEVTNALNIIGLNGDEMAAAISKGGEDGYNATQKIIEGLLSIKDPLEQNRLGMQIFGTMWEDAGGKAILAMANTKGEIEQTKNSMEQLSTFSIDKSADAFKEFTIKITEGGEEVTNALNIIGLNGDEMAAAISKGGEDGYNATQKIIEGLLSIKDPLEQNRLGMQIFGTMWEDAGGKAILAMANTKGEIEQTKNSMEQLSNTNLDSMSNQWEQIGRTLKNELLTPIVEELLPKIQELVEYLMGNLPEVKNWIVVIGTALGAVFAVNSIATFISSISTIVTTIKTLDIVTKIVTATQWLWNAALSANPIGVVVMAIAGLVAGIVLLWNNCEGFRNVVLGLWEVLKTYLTPILKVLEVLFSQVLPQAINILKQKWEVFKNFCIQIWDNIKNSISEKMNIIIKFFTQDIPKANQILIEKFIELKDKIIEKIVVIWNRIVQWGEDLWNFATKDIPNFVLKVIEYIAQLPSDIWKWLKEAITKVIEWGENLFKEGKNAALKLFNSIVDNIKNLPNKIMQIGKDIITGLWNGINEKISWLIGKIEDFGTGIINKVKGIFDIHSPSRVFKAIGKYIMEGLGLGIKEGTNYPMEEMEKIGQNIINSGNEISTGLVFTDKTTGQQEKQKADELNYLKEMQLYLNKDLEIRKELEQLQTEIKAAENEKRTAKEIQELKIREKELITSLKNNENELKKLSGKVLSISREYGENFLSGFKSTENGLKNYINDICSYMRSQLDSISSYCDSIKGEVQNIRSSASNISLGRASETINSYGSILMSGIQGNSSRIIEKTENKSNNINVTQHIYNNTQDPRLQQKRAIRELRKQALGV